MSNITGYAEGAILRIEVVPLTPDAKFWAFATMTNNITIVTT
jgi:hypothetical protein